MTNARKLLTTSGAQVITTEEGITDSSDMTSERGQGRHNQNMQIYN